MSLYTKFQDDTIADLENRLTLLYKGEMKPDEFNDFPALQRALWYDDHIRIYLGASQIGHSCDRYLYYSFRGCAKRELSIEGIRAICDGFTQEEKIATMLKSLPYITLHTTDPDKANGEQIEVVLLNGHFKGHLDGTIKGLLQAPKSWHVWENKSVNETKFKKLQDCIQKYGEKNALKEWDYTYYCQAQVYMGDLELSRHYLTVTTPGGRQIQTCRTDFVRKDFELIVDKAQRIIFDTSNFIPSRMSEKKEFFQCKWCEMSHICHDLHFPDVNCRSCRYRSPEKNGINVCMYDESVIDREARLHIGCENHLFNPALMPDCKIVSLQKDCNVYKIKNISHEVIFANVTATGLPLMSQEVDLVYTSFELKENIVSIPNLAKLTKDTDRVIRKFQGTVVNQDDLAPYQDDLDFKPAEKEIKTEPKKPVVIVSRKAKGK